MSKYGKDIVNRIVDLISSDSYTISEICRTVGINIDTYYSWLKKSEFSEAIKKAKNTYNDFIKTEAEKSLVRMVRGYTVEEKKTVKAGAKVKEYTVTEKHIQPNPALIIFTLTNRDPEKWKNRQYTDVTSNGESIFNSIELNIIRNKTDIPKPNE